MLYISAEMSKKYLVMLIFYYVFHLKLQVKKIVLRSILGLILINFVSTKAKEKVSSFLW